MSAASERREERVDVDLVAAQFELLDTETHRKALLEAVRARDAYRKLIDELREKIAKLEQGLIGPKRERFRVQDKDQLSIEILAELLGKAERDSADAEHLVEQLEAEAPEHPIPRCTAGPGLLANVATPDWPRSRLLELAPCNWKQTRQQPHTQQLLEESFWLGILCEIDLAHARVR